MNIVGGRATDLPHNSKDMLRLDKRSSLLLPLSLSHPVDWGHVTTEVQRPAKAFATAHLHIDSLRRRLGLVLTTIWLLTVALWRRAALVRLWRLLRVVSALTRRRPY